MQPSDVIALMGRVLLDDWEYRVTFGDDPGKTTYIMSGTGDRYGYLVSLSDERCLIDELGMTPKAQVEEAIALLSYTGRGATVVDKKFFLQNEAA